MAYPAKKGDIPLTEKMRHLTEELNSGQFADFYILDGEQAYLRNQKRDEIKKALVGEDESMNYARFTGNGFTAKEVIELAETMPFFAERRVILLEDTGLFAKEMKGEADLLAAYVKEMSPTTTLVFSETKVDRTRALYKAMTAKDSGKKAVALTFDGLDEGTLRSWAGQYFRQNGKSISGPTLAFFLQTVGEDMIRIRQEQDKLISFLGFGPDAEKEILPEHIKQLCTPLVAERIFEMIDAIAGGRREEALSLYMDLLKRQTAPQVILSLLSRNFKRLLILKEAGDRLDGDSEVLRKLGIKDWMYRRNYAPLLRQHSSASLKAALERCVRADADYKRGKVSDVLAVEMLLAAREEGKR